MDWTSLTAELAKPLDKHNVKERAQAGRKLSYIEGWHAIAEANRIFGFGEWTRETLEIRCVSERPRKIGKDHYEKDGWGVSYIARVRVTVGGIIRDGVGAGHGIDADIGLAHESAIKEAETDAMKRSLMTFGNPFGLALYDKSQANVDDGNGHGKPDSPPQRRTPTHEAPKGSAPPAPAPADLFEQLKKSLSTVVTAEELKGWMSEADKWAGDLPEKEFQELDRLLEARREFVRPKSPAPAKRALHPMEAG